MSPAERRYERPADVIMNGVMVTLPLLSGYISLEEPEGEDTPFLGGLV